MTNNLFPQAFAKAPEWANTVEGVASIGSLESLISNAITGITAFAGVAILATIVISGFTFLFSGGDAKQLEKAKNSFTYAVIGLIVIVSAYLILSLIELLTGAKVTEFNLNI